jgi:hypothetical protein
LSAEARLRAKADATKQSTLPCCPMDCFAALAMTTTHTFAIPQAARPGFAINFPPSPIRGRADAGRPVRPIAACAEVVVERTRVSQVTPEITRHSPRDVSTAYT